MTLQWAVCLLALPSCLVAAVDANWIREAGGTVEQDKAGRIIRVDLRSSWVTDSDMPRLAQFRDLAVLDLSLTRISDRGLRGLRSAPAVIDLNLFFAEQITDDGMSAIRGWKHLKRLVIRGTKITDSTLEFLAGLPALESLDIGYAQITDAGLVHLGSISTLRELAIGGNKLAGTGLQFLRQLPQLRYLDIGGSQRTDSGLWSVSLTEDGLTAIATITDLRELRLAGTGVSASGIEILQALPALERLSLENCKKLGDDAVPALASLKQLKRVDLHDSGVTEQGRAKLLAAKPGLEIIP